MTIHNESDEADALVRANCPLANFSERRAVDVGEGGLAERAIPNIPVVAHATLKLAPRSITSACCRRAIRSRRARVSPSMRRSAARDRWRCGSREFFTGGGPLQPERITGSVTVIDVTTGKVAGKFETKFPNLGGTLATTDLVFSGEPGGEVYALDGKTPQKPLGFNTGGGVSAPPMTFEVEGKQYVAILVGMGRAWDKGFIDSTPELKTMQPGSTLCVFAL